jgi:hypothetical protein
VAIEVKTREFQVTYINSVKPAAKEKNTISFNYIIVSYWHNYWRIRAR